MGTMAWSEWAFSDRDPGSPIDNVFLNTWRTRNLKLAQRPVPLFNELLTYDIWDLPAGSWIAQHEPVTNKPSQYLPIWVPPGATRLAIFTFMSMELRPVTGSSSFSLRFRMGSAISPEMVISLSQTFMHLATSYGWYRSTSVQIPETMWDTTQWYTWEALGVDPVFDIARYGFVGPAPGRVWQPPGRADEPLGTSHALWIGKEEG